MKYSRNVAINVVIANMIGTGIFFSLGYQVGDLPSWFSIMTLWIVGAIIAILGALCYSEISTRIKGAGGEYQYLSKIYHPALGFIAGWVSFIVGFAAPIAVVAIGIGEYTKDLFNINEKFIAVIAILVSGIIHILGVKSGSLFQNIVTRFKILFLISLILMPIVIIFFHTDFNPTSQVIFNPFSNGVNDFELIFSSEFAVSLVWCYLSYSGWNAAVYFSDRIENPEKNIPFSLITGTIVVSLLYLLLNTSFIYTIDFANIKPQADIGNTYLGCLLPEHISKPFSILFGIALISSLSSMLIAGPSVLQTMGKDYQKIKVLNKKNKYDSPYIAILWLMFFSIFLVFNVGFKDLVEYVGVILSVFAVLVVLGVPILRMRQKVSNESVVYKTPLGKLISLIFAIVNLFMIYYIFSSDIIKLIYVLITLLIGYILYFFTKN